MTETTTWVYQPDPDWDYTETSGHPECTWSCGRYHPPSEPHCPNCGEPAGMGFHAGWNLAECPIWINGRGWVPWLGTTPAERKATWHPDEDEAS